MDTTQLEDIRDIWMAAFFSGDYAVLEQYEHTEFKVVHEQEGRVEANFTRYDLIAHAVQNGIWKPQKPDVESESFEFDASNNSCKVLIVLGSLRKIREIWHFTEQGWQITELRFLKD